MARFIHPFFYQGHVRYHGRARQYMANSLSSLIMAQNKSLHKWDAETINQILERGDSCSSVNSYMVLEDLPNQCALYNKLEINNILHCLAQVMFFKDWTCLI